MQAKLIFCRSSERAFDLAAGPDGRPRHLVMSEASQARLAIAALQNGRSVVALADGCGSGWLAPAHTIVLFDVEMDGEDLADLRRQCRSRVIRPLGLPSLTRSAQEAVPAGAALALLTHLAPHLV